MAFIVWMASLLYSGILRSAHDRDGALGQHPARQYGVQYPSLDSMTFSCRIAGVKFSITCFPSLEKSRVGQVYGQCIPNAGVLHTCQVGSMWADAVIGITVISKT